MKENNRQINSEREWLRGEIQKVESNWNSRCKSLQQQVHELESARQEFLTEIESYQVNDSNFNK